MVKIARGCDVFFGRQIENKQPVDSRTFSGIVKLLPTKLKDWVHVGVENNRNLRGFPNFAHAIQDFLNGCAAGQCALRGQLVHNSIGQRIGKRQSKFEDIGSRPREGETQSRGLREGRISRTYVRNKTFAFFATESLETFIDPISHGFETAGNRAIASEKGRPSIRRKCSGRGKACRGTATSKSPGGSRSSG